MDGLNKYFHDAYLSKVDKTLRLIQTENACINHLGNGKVNGFDDTGSLTYSKSSGGLQLESVNFGSGVIRVTGSTGNQ